MKFIITVYVFVLINCVRDTGPLILCGVGLNQLKDLKTTEWTAKHRHTSKLLAFVFCPKNPCKKPKSSHPSLNCTLSKALLVPDIPLKLELSLLCLCSIDLTISLQPDFYPHSLCLSWGLETAPSWFLNLQQGSGFGLAAPFISLLHLFIECRSILVPCVGHSSYPHACWLLQDLNSQHNSRQANQDILFCKIMKVFPTSNTACKEHIFHFHMLNLSLIITSPPNYGLSPLGARPGVHLAQRQDCSFCSL